MDQRQEELATNLDRVHARIAEACTAAGRNAEDVTLITVTKFFPAADVERLAALGVSQMGENREQEAGPKFAELSPSVRAAVRLHFIGQLQTNKAGRVASYADVVQSVDRARLVRALDRGAAAALQAGDRQTPLDVTLQVDLGQGADQGRGGALPEDVTTLADLVVASESLRLRGLMAVAPRDLDADGIRAAFDRLATLSGELGHTSPDATWLSMGMSADLELAVAAGATHLRVGTAILGSRPSAE
ncbi:MAG: YggS family pyridoxal phosphate-dependent enzyme [Ornithinimicrobium sp.]|uniref:YggS family pyridoxal phosphate-dependent enzyme n=1 Tax=Ornithinimicrobium sp. TaxID=1977084 RepID=UPI0026E0E9FF|nr:YggS family pyridoxal phosphate-dependent enzyme [Ornithinimicrobium sp.]MDO5741256.1 YggS family pyridoxal phosphate-dependent enzyme [Ornithinimicrobium sp.]